MDTSQSNDYETLYQYWFLHPKVWFDSSPKDDMFIRDTFRHLISEYPMVETVNILSSGKEAKIGLILALDQVSRHCLRCGDFDQNQVDEFTRIASLITQHFIYALKIDKSFSCAELCFILMPYRHMDIDDIELAIKVMNDYISKQTPDQLSKRFIRAAYKKLMLKINEEHMSKVILDDSIIYKDSDVSLNIPRQWVRYIRDICGDPKSSIETPLILSLSGGIDSVVLLECLNTLNYSVIAIHINYCNRFPVCDNEQRFVEDLCNKLNIPLVVRRFQELTKSTPNVDRQSYEEITKQVRFDMYKRLGCDNRRGVLLGHHLDDCLENIVGNIVKGKHLDNLKGMTNDTTINGVRVLRPFISVFKREIIDFATDSNISYLEDNTSVECVRGKFRKQLLPMMRDYNSHFEMSLLSLDNTVSQLYTIMDDYCDRLVSESYTIESSDDFNEKMICVRILDRSFNIPPNLPPIAWRNLCNKLGIYNISHRSLDNLVSKLACSERIRKHALNKEVVVYIGK